MRLIDVEHIPYEDGFDRVDGNKHFIFGVETMQEWIKDQPTVDAVPVVRCKDCRHWAGVKDDGSCAIDALLRPRNHFCSYGERK